MCSGEVGLMEKAGEGWSELGQGSRAGTGKVQPGGCRVYEHAVDWECQRPQAQTVGSGVPVEASAAAPIRRKLCQVKGAQGDPARSEWRVSWRCCLDGAKGPPALVEVVVSDASRVAQAAAQGPRGELTQEWPTFSSKKERVVGWRSSGRMLAASPMRRSWEKERKARQVVRASVGVEALWAR